ncbi:MAG: CRISPR-associated protein Csx18 [Cyanobacteriota bacterium]|nr:CRISPR-associated protein Csx18 [Cyanobacteriota bacterium]
MYLSPRAAFIRNLLVSISGGSIALIILLIAPLGLAAVIVNTLLVTLAIYGVSGLADRIVIWLQPNSSLEATRSLSRQRDRISNLNRWR